MSLYERIEKMDEAELASLVSGAVGSMQTHTRSALVASIFDAFRETGESSEDAAEGAGTHLPLLENNDADALRALVNYARENKLLKDALEELAQEHAAELSALL